MNWWRLPSRLLAAGVLTIFLTAPAPPPAGQYITIEVR